MSSITGKTNEKGGVDTTFDENVVVEDLAPLELHPTANLGNLVYQNDEEEPELHMRTYVALLAMFLLNYVLILALNGPAAVLSFIGKDLNAAKTQTWIADSMLLVGAVLSPLLATISDTFQARKSILVSTCIVALIGAAIAPGSRSVGRLIAAQVMIGVGFASTPLGYTVPSEILPRRWRPMAQAGMNVAAGLGAISGPLIIGALTQRNAHMGWRYYYWMQMAIWGAAALGIFFGYNPPKRHTRYDSLSILQKLGRLDLPGCGLLTAGLTLLITGLNFGGGLFSWTAPQTLAPLTVGIAALICFGIYEWKFTKTGILTHELFQGADGRGLTFAICFVLIFIEGIMLYSYLVFFPLLSVSLFETHPFLITVRSLPFWLAGTLFTVIYGAVSVKLRTIRVPMFVGFLLFTAGIVGIATIQPDDSTRSLIFAALAAIGFAGPLVLIIAGVQLSTPHHLIATATALTSSARNVAGSLFTAVFAAALSNRTSAYIPKYIAAAALKAGLPPTSVPSFVEALAGNMPIALHQVPGVTPAIIGAGVVALKQALADSIRVVYIIAAPFGALACISCYFLGDLQKVMNYHVDAPVENLHEKHHHEEGQQT